MARRGAREEAEKDREGGSRGDVSGANKREEAHVESVSGLEE
jgi:hypothetical protein